jgi:branched-chain amino acid transport system ATP-binding protein
MTLCSKHTWAKDINMLRCENLSASYGDIRALHDVSLHVDHNEVVALIGVNGAGKTTLLKAISGVVATRGEIVLDGVNVERGTPQKRVKLGVAHVPEGRRIFPGLTVFENLMVGSYVGQLSRDVKETLDFIYQLFPRLHERRKQLGWSLSGGEQQMLAIGRALMSQPKLLLDEPSLGLAPRLAEEVYRRISEIRGTGLTILVVEQNTVLALEVASRAYVIESGKITMSGDAEQLQKDPRVRNAYLGI